MQAPREGRPAPCKAPGPFPDIRCTDTRQNIRLATRMMRAYNEALCLTMTHTYQHLITEVVDKEASDLFAGLAEGDMARFRTLGQLIRALGGDPGMSLRLQTQRVDLSEDPRSRALPALRRMLKQDLRDVAEGITELESLAAAADGWVADTLRLLIREMQLQYEALERLLRRVWDGCGGK